MKKHWFSDTARLLLRIAAAILFLLPLLWMVTAALHPLGVPLPRRLTLIPDGLTLENFSRVLELVPLARYSLNSLIVAAIAVPLTIVTASWAGFAIAQLPKAAQRRWVLGSLALLMVPGIALWLPRFLLYVQIGIINTPLTLIAPAVMGTSPFFILMYYRAFRRLPTVIYDAAQLDGAGVLGTWGRVALPLANSTTLAVGLLAFLTYWGDFISPTLYIRTDEWKTAPVALSLLEQLSRAEWAVLMAGAVLVTMVPIVLFVGVQFALRRTAI
jgi:multiple sugar transport system permease protein